MVKIKEVKLKILHKTETKKVAKMVKFIKTCDPYPRKFNFDHFFSSTILLSPFLLRKNRFSKNVGRVK